MKPDLHYDLVFNMWAEGYQQCAAKHYVERPDWIQPKTDGSYSFTTDWHREEECPFKDGVRLWMKPVKAPDLT